MKTLLRIATGLPGAAIITSLIFLLLASVISRHQDVRLDEDRSVQINVTPQIEDRSMQRPEDIVRPVLDQPPPPPPMLYDHSFQPSMAVQMGEMPDLGGGDLDMVTGSTPNWGAQPLVRVPPQYPGRCQRTASSVESVVVEFDVTPEGTVINPRVLDSSNACFNPAAMRAVEQWRYQPSVVDEVAQPRFGVRTAIDFSLE